MVLEIYLSFLVWFCMACYVMVSLVDSVFYFVFCYFEVIHASFCVLKYALGKGTRHLELRSFPFQSCWRSIVFGYIWVATLSVSYSW